MEEGEDNPRYLQELDMACRKNRMPGHIIGTPRPWDDCPWGLRVSFSSADSCWMRHRVAKGEESQGSPPRRSIFHLNRGGRRRQDKMFARASDRPSRDLDASASLPLNVSRVSVALSPGSAPRRPYQNLHFERCKGNSHRDMSNMQREACKP